MKKVLLLVEDDEALLDALKSELNQKDEFAVFIAKDGLEAGRYLQKS